MGNNEPTRRNAHLHAGGRAGQLCRGGQPAGTVRSVVTRQVAALEEHLGVKLMVRSTRSLTLTSAGAAYLDKCRAILDMVDAAEAELMEERATPGASCG